jgi:VRR-NUC domain
MNSTPPLLALAEGRRVRLRRAPTLRPKEIGLHIAVAAILRTQCEADWIWFHVPNGEVRDKRLAAKLKAMGVKPGIPDLVLLSSYNSVRFLELKRKGESLSEEQEEFRILCIRLGHPHAIARSVEDAVAILESWGCLRKVGRAVESVPLRR